MGTCSETIYVFSFSLVLFHKNLPPLLLGTIIFVLEKKWDVYMQKKCTDTGTPDNHKVHSKVAATFNSFH